MDDLISRAAAIEAISKGVRDDAFLIVALIKSKINKVPSAQPERKKGRWIVKEKGCKLTSYQCSECGRYIAEDTGYDVKKDYPFCHCGADMREENT